MKGQRILLSFLLVSLLCGTRAQLYYKSNNSIWIGDSVTNYDLGLNSRDYPGFYWCDSTGTRFLKMDCTPANPRLSFSGGKVFATGRVLASSFIISSDSTKKTDISPILNGVDILSAVSPYILSTDKAASKSIAGDNRTFNITDLSYNIDVAALKELMPSEVVTVGGKDYFNYTALIPVLVSGIKTLRENIALQQEELHILNQQAAVAGSKSRKGGRKLPLECNYRIGKADLVYNLPEGSRENLLQLCDASGKQTCLTGVSRSGMTSITPDDLGGKTGFCTLISDGKVIATVRVEFPDTTTDKIK